MHFILSCKITGVSVLTLLTDVCCLQGNPCTHPIIILRDVGYIHMRGLLEFMYAGEVNVSQAHLAAFLRTAEALKVRGLAEAPEQQQHSSVQQAAAAAAAAAAVGSMADLLKSSMASLPLGSLGSPLAQHAAVAAAAAAAATMPITSDTKGLHNIHISNQTAGQLHHQQLQHHNNSSSNNNNNINNNIHNNSNNSFSDSKLEIKADLCTEPLPLTVNNNNLSSNNKLNRTPSPHQCSKRFKCNHSSSEGNSGPSSPHMYHPATSGPHSNGGGCSVASDALAGSGALPPLPPLTPTDDDEVAHDLSSSSSSAKHQRPGKANTQVSLPPSLVPASSPENMQYVFKVWSRWLLP